MEITTQLVHAKQLLHCSLMEGAVRDGKVAPIPYNAMSKNAQKS